MRMRTLWHASILAAVVASSASVTGSAAAQSSPARPFALVGGTLLDGSGGPPLQNSIVLIRGERIERIGTVDTLSVPDDYEEVSTEGMTVLPGLWDPHVHMLYNGHPDFSHWFSTYAGRFADATIPASAQQLLLAGVTSVRDLAAPTADILAVRKRIENGELPGPTIYASGAALQPGAAPATTPHIETFSGPEDAATKTRELAEAGVDVIKLLGMQGRPIEEIRAVVDAAHAAGLKVTAHGRTDEEIRLGLAAGIDEFQHIGTDSSEYPADVLDAIAARVGTGPPLYWSPTVGPQLNADDLSKNREFLDDPRNFASLPVEIAEDVRRAVAKAEPSPPAPYVATIVARKIEQLRKLGVDFVAGSDMGTFGQPASEALWRDLDAWVRELGMDPMTAIRWVTSEAAEYMGVAEDYGTVVPGKYADIIAVRGNPLEHIDVLRAPRIVIKHGSLYQ